MGYLLAALVLLALFVAYRLLRAAEAVRAQRAERQIAYRRCAEALDQLAETAAKLGLRVDITIDDSKNGTRRPPSGPLNGGSGAGR